MRIIKTAVRKRGAKTAAAAVTLLTIPAAAIACVRVLPDPIEYMRQAVAYSEIEGMFSYSSDMNNGSQLLYSAEINKNSGNTDMNVSESVVPADSDPGEDTAEAENTEHLTVSGEDSDMNDTDDTVTSYETDNNDTETINDDYRLSVNISDKTEDITAFAAHSGKIAEETFGFYSGGDYIELERGGQIRNCTELSAEEVSRVASQTSVVFPERFSSEPQVLIIHTHTSESYEPFEKDWYDESYTARSEDPENSVVAVGEAIARRLAANGICVIHDGTVHDSRYSGAYSRSSKTAADILNKYPSVKIILDIHRDAIEYEDGTRVSAVTEINGRKAAQVMIICAADDGTYDVPDFKNNLRFAGELQQSMESLYPTLTRPVLFQYCQYNQQLSPGALLIEVGSHGNTVEQAVYSGELIGEALSRLIEDKSPDIIPVNSTVPLYFIDRLM